MGRLIAHLPRTRTIAYCATGMLAAGGGITAAHRVAGLINPAASLVLAVSSTVIDATPPPVKEYAVGNRGQGCGVDASCHASVKATAMTYYRIRRKSRAADLCRAVPQVEWLSDPGTRKWLVVAVPRAERGPDASELGVGVRWGF